MKMPKNNRQRTIQVCALNISMHKPHSPSGYVDLFTSAMQRKRVFEQGEAYALMLGSLENLANGVEENEITGEVFRFIKVDPSEPWFNTIEHRQATDEELAQVQIPAHLQMNMRRIPFVFYPKQHELWFIAEDGKNRLGPSYAERFFQALFDDVVRDKNLPQVGVTAIPDHDSVNKVFRLDVLSKVTMIFKRPNPDDAGDIAARIVERMQNQNLMLMREELTAPRGMTISPDEITLAYAAVAAKNGRVESNGYDDKGVKVKRSTTNIPLRVPVLMNDENETTMNALRRAKDEV